MSAISSDEEVQELLAEWRHIRSAAFKHVRELLADKNNTARVDPDLLLQAAMSVIEFEPFAYLTHPPEAGNDEVN